ncbi:MAG: Gldg family protein [Bacteroidetes bacterium]|nr:Gldg family protein [Bacteroidota bacterium]
MKQGRTYYLQALLALGILLLVNFFAGHLIFRIDLTEEGRYTLSDVTRQTMDSLGRTNQVMTVKVYLDGENLPARLKRYREAVRTTLVEMKVHAGDRLQFEFVDPSTNAALQRHLVEQGVPTIPIAEQKGNTELRQQLIFPGVVVNYAGSEQVINLLFNDCYQVEGGQYQCDYQKAESEIEYKLVSQMQRMLPGQKRIVGIVTSHACLKPSQMPEFTSELRRFYDVITLPVKAGTGIPASAAFLPDSVRRKLPKDAYGIDVLIIARPDSIFSEAEKYELDQYIMQGGRVLWLVDQETVDEKDFQNADNPATISILRELNLDDMFFRYGFRVGVNLLEDMQAGRKEVMMTLPGSESRRGPRPVPVPYYYFSLVTGTGILRHEITKAIEAVEFRYASTLDTLPQPGLRHYPLLRSSQYSRAKEGTQMLNLQNILAFRPPKDLFTGKGNRMLGLALEGKFPSVFAGRRLPWADSLKARKRVTLPENAYTNRMVVFSDGDLALPSDLRFTGSRTIPWNNKQLLLNSVDWLIGDKTFNQIRARDVVIRRLDADKVMGRAWLYQVLNIAIPVLLVISAGLFRHWRRRRRNHKLKQA